MSPENVEVVRTLDRAFNESGADGFLRVFSTVADAEVEWREDPNWPGAGTYHGMDGVRAVFEDRLSSFAVTQEVEELFDTTDEVVSFVRWTGTAKSGGASADMSLAIVFSFRGGKIVRVVFYFDRSAALEAAGLRA